jgi:hypothetical protein
MNKRNIFYILGLLGIITISISSVLLLTRNVISFDVIGVSNRDCVPYNVFIRRGEREHSVDVEWSTKAECVGFIQYGRDRSNLDLVSVDLENRSKSKEHIVNIDQLLSSEIYYFLINSQEQAYGHNGVPLEFVMENL